MEERVTRVFTYWAMGLFLFVATLLVVHWTRNVVPWSKLDSGWTQAFGSLAALGVAIYVLREQTSVAIEAENRALKRQADSVSAIVAKLHDELQHYAKRLRKSDEAAKNLFDLKDAEAFFEVSKAVDAIPLHSLGSVKMVRGIFEMQKAAREFGDLFKLGRVLDQVEPDFHKWDVESIVRRADFVGLTSNIAYGIFLDGYNALIVELDTLHHRQR